MKCKGCNSELQKIEYQARSADEAHSSAYRCPYCPLSIDKFSNPIKSPHLYLKRSTRVSSQTSLIDSGESQVSRILCVESKSVSKSGDGKTLTARACNYIDTNSKLFKSYVTGPWARTARSVVRKQYIGLNAWIESIAYVDNAPMNDKHYADFEYIMFGKYVGILHNDSITLTFDAKDCDNDTILVHLTEMYLMGFSPTSLPVYINRVFLGSMSNMNARAYDASNAADNQHNFSTKPDGERMWLVGCGSTWLYCRRLLDFEVIGWYIDTELRYIDRYAIAPVIDLEVMLGHPPILIDILLTEQKKLSPYDRDILWIQSKMSELKHLFPYLDHVHMRRFFRTFDEAYRYSLSVEYPTDGLVAVSDHSTDMKKLKPLKSIELQVVDNGFLATKEGTRLARLDSNCNYRIGSIVELRFSVKNGTIHVHDSFERSDKRSPNTDSAVDSIAESCMESMTDGMTRTMLWRWSNKLRFYIYQKAYTMNKDKNVILDIGSGSGQSTEAFDKAPNCSFILIEPDRSKCRMLARRLDVKQVHSDPRSIITAVSALKQGSKRYHILNTDLKTVLRDKPVMTNIRQILKCSIASFSSHFIADEIDTIVELGIPFIGCYYSYADISIGSCIIDASSIKMQRISHDTATVKWGSDKIYSEPIRDPATESLSIDSINAIEVVPSPINDMKSPVYSACSHVKILISR